MSTCPSLIGLPELEPIAHLLIVACLKQCAKTVLGLLKLFNRTIKKSSSF